MLSMGTPGGPGGPGEGGGGITNNTFIKLNIGVKGILGVRGFLFLVYLFLILYMGLLKVLFVFRSKLYRFFKLITQLWILFNSLDNL